ncbi:MAG TPA: PQQ-binding-like beta-propeller repeat protein [bacterium]|nr:PQQ-binding-like beta-propeller repeat protein [bacterium]
MSVRATPAFALLASLFLAPILATDPADAAGGDVVWVFQGIEDVLCADEIQDQNADGVRDVIVETYDAGASGDHLYCLSGDTPGANSVTIWKTKPPGGPSSSGGYGDECLQTAPDLNDDGIQDVLLGTAWGGRTAYGIDGTDGSVIWDFDTYVDRPPGVPESGWIFTITSVPDVDGDGGADAFFGVGSDNNRVYHVNGRDGTVLWSWYVGDAVFSSTPLDDVSGDGKPDAALGVGDFAEAVWVFRGGSTLTPVEWSQPMPGSVLSLARVEDISGDGTNDVVAGTWASQVFAFDGANGDTIWVANLPQPGYVMKIAVLKDVNDDGAEDLAIGSWDDRVFVLSGMDGAELWSFPTGGDVWTVGTVDDVSGDGVNDVVAGSFDKYVYVLDGTDGSEVWRYNTGHRVYYVTGLNDLTGDGIPDVFAGTQMLSGNGGLGILLEGGPTATPVGDLARAEAADGADGVSLRLSHAFGAQHCFVERSAGRPNDGAARSSFRAEVAAAYAEGSLRTADALQARRQDPGIRWSRVSTAMTPVTSGGAETLDRSAEPGRTYTYRFALVRDGAVVGYSGEATVTRGAVEVAVPRITARPNPLQGSGVEVEFRVPAPQRVRLHVHDAAGRRVGTLLDGPVDGEGSVTWTARDASGDRLPAGVYFLRLEGEGFASASKVTVLR